MKSIIVKVQIQLDQFGNENSESYVKEVLNNANTLLQREFRDIQPQILCNNIPSEDIEVTTETHYDDFVDGEEVETTVYMSAEDVGEEIKVGTIGTICSEPSDDEELVGVTINGSLHYLPQDVLNCK